MATAGRSFLLRFFTQTAGERAVMRDAEDLNRVSRRITMAKQQGASQAMLIGSGIAREDLTLPQVGIASVWFEGNPCNMHLLRLGELVKRSLRDLGVIGLQFNTIGVSDGISMGTEGMSFSLQSRDLIADSIETLCSAQWHDGLVTLPGCDKNMPGCVMAMARLNRPSLMVYGGSIKSGRSKKGDALDVVSAFQSYGQLICGSITEEERNDIICNACPGAGACGGMYTANTMACAIEALGLSLPYSSSNPAESDAKVAECHIAAEAVKNLLAKNITPSMIMTEKSFENAITLIMVLGGSTNAVLHLIAMARAIDIKNITIDTFQKISDKTPLLGDLKPSGKFSMQDVHELVGGIPPIMKYLLSQGLLHGDCLTVTGKTLAENLQDNDVQDMDFERQKVIAPLNNALQTKGHLKILRGNLAPEGAVAKITGKEGTSFTGPANVFDSEEEMLLALEQRRICKGDVVIIRYEGPKGGPGMPEMLTPTSAIVGAGLAKDVALVTDGRFSGGSHGFIVGHITPEAQECGPIALVRNGDVISIDTEKLTICVDLRDDELQRRKETFKAPPFKVTKGTLLKYVKNVKSASLGCVTDEL